MNDRHNTIAGWILFAGIVALGSSIVSSEVFNSHRPHTMGYPIEGVEVEGEGGEAAKPIEFYLASADPAKGEQVFKKCTACHNADKGGANTPARLISAVSDQDRGRRQRVPTDEELFAIGRPTESPVTRRGSEVC